MKSLLRKPLLPILIFIIMIFEICFMGIFRQGIERDKQMIEDLYNNTQIKYRVISGNGSLGGLKFYIRNARMLEWLDFIEDSFYYIDCPYTVREPRFELDYGVLYGTNKIDRFLNERDIPVTFLEGFDHVNDWIGCEEETPCLIEKNIALDINLSLGDTFVVAPYDGRGIELSDRAPNACLKVVGIYENKRDVLKNNGIIIPDNIFTDKPNLLYNWVMMRDHCFLKQYEFSINRAYNRQCDEVEQQVIDTIQNPNYSLNSNVRKLKQSVRIIEQKLQISQFLVRPLEIGFAIITAVLVVLMAISIQTDIFLKILWGESRIKIFINYIILFLAVLGISSLVSANIGVLILGNEWLGWIVKYIGEIVSLSIVASIIPLIIFCSKNLVDFFQTMES